MIKSKSGSRNKSMEFNKVLHPNRYFIWAVFVILFIFAALISYIYISTLQMDNESVFSQTISRRNYTNSALGFAVKYPNSWTLENTVTGGIVFENPADIEENITVVSGSLGLETQIRKALVQRHEIDYQKPGYSVAIIKADSGKNSSNFDAAIIKTPRKLFYISGRSAYFQGFVNNFKPL